MKQKLSNKTEYSPLVGNVLRLLILVLILSAILFLLDQSQWADYAIPRYQGTRGYTEASWIYRQGDTVLESRLETPAFRHMKTGKTYSISTRLTYDGSKDDIPFCFYFVDHMYTRALLDGEVLFSYTKDDVEKLDKSKSPGNVYSSFQLPEDCLGRELVIEFIPALTADIDYQLPHPVFGDFSTQAANTFWNDLPHNVVAVLSGILGIASILFSSLALKGSKYREGLFIGIFATLFSLYNLTESDFDFYVISNPYYTYLLDYTCFTLIPIALMAFLRERFNTRQRPMATAMIFIGLIMFCTELTLHFSGIMDMREFLTVLHIVYFADLLIIFFLLSTMKRNRWKVQLILQMIPILCGVIIDAAVYYKHWQLDSSDSTFTSIGVLIFLIAELFHVWKYSIDVYTESIRSQDYRQMAYIDSLTGTGNRRAFDVEKSNIQEDKKPFKSLIIISVDVNDLKLTNDTLGHAAGDFLIRSAANVLSDLCEDFGHAFRVGGDEFVLFLYDIPQEELDSRLKHLDYQVQAINIKSKAKLSLAIGYEVAYRENLSSALEKADKNMYANKARMKQTFPQRKD